MTTLLFSGWYLLIGMVIAYWSWNKTGQRVLGYLSPVLKLLCFMVYAAIWPIAISVDIYMKLKRPPPQCGQCAHRAHRGRCSQRVRIDIPGQELGLETVCPCGAEPIPGLGRFMREE